MNCLDFDWQVDEFMVYFRSTQLREKTMNSYEQALRLFVPLGNLCNPRVFFSNVQKKMRLSLPDSA